MLKLANKRVFIITLTVLFIIVCSLLSEPLKSTDNRTVFKNEVLLNNKRVEQAERYFKRQNKTDKAKYYHSLISTGGIYLSVAITTVSRSYRNTSGPGYLMQSAAALDTFAHSSEFLNKTFVFVCNVDTKPDNHSDARFLGSYLPFAERYGASSFDISNPIIPGTTTTYKEQHNTGIYEKENYDYMYCLKVAQSLNPKYILMVEDDAIAHKALPQVLKFYLDDQTSSLKRQKQFGFLKLYYPIQWQGFAFEIVSILQLISIGVIGGGLSVLRVYVFSSFYQRKVSIRTYQGYFIAGMIFLMLCAEILGRHNLLEVRRVSRYLYQLRPSPGCCTPAMLYPRSIVNPLVGHLATSTKHTDLAIRDFVLQTHIPAYYIEPNLFYHIGMYTSLVKKNKKKRPDDFLFYV